MNAEQQRAYADTMEQSVLLPVFFHRLEERGITASTEKEASALVRIYRNLGTYATVETSKRAAAAGNLLETAAYALERTMEEQGVLKAASSNAPRMPDDREIKQAAALFMQDPEVASAAFALRQSLELA